MIKLQHKQLSSSLNQLIYGFFLWLQTSLEVLKDLVLSLEDYGFQLGRNLTSNKADSIVVKKSSNIELHVKVVKPRSYSLSHYTLFQFPNSSFNLTPNAFVASENATAVAVVVYYRTLHSILTQEKLRLRQTNLTTKKTGHMINGRIITASVRPNPPKEFETPVRIRWKNKYSVRLSRCRHVVFVVDGKSWKIMNVDS